MSNAQYSGQLPSQQAVAGNDDGTITGIWYQFFAWLASLTASQFESQSVGLSSPYVFQASKIGHLHVAAGAGINSVVLQRGGESLACPTSDCFIPVVAGDEIIIDWLVAGPALVTTFVPGART